MRRASAVGVLLVTAFVACGGNPLPAADYFPAVEVELTRLDQATKDLTDRFATELENELERVISDADLAVPGEAERAFAAIIRISQAKMEAIIRSHNDQVELLTGRIEQLTPPDVIASAHQEFLGAFAAWAASGVETIALLYGATDIASLAEVLTSSPYADAQLRVDQACDALRQSATAVGVALTCPGSQVELLDVGP